MESKKVSCETCKFWRCYDAGLLRGVCHVLPPNIALEIVDAKNMIVNGKPGRDFLYPTDSASKGRPLTEGIDWCGQHQFAEKKVNDERLDNPNMYSEYDDATSMEDRYISPSMISIIEEYLG